MDDFKVDFIGVGVNKAGTSWLNKMLDAHPMICTSIPKEIHFFHDQVTLTRAEHFHNFPKGLDWYKRFFRHCSAEKVKGEITPRYFIDPVTPQRMFQMFPDVKLILCLRSPVDRAASHYYFERYFNRRESRPISQAIREEPIYVLHGLYYAGIQRILEYFSMANLHLIWFEDIALKPEQVLSEVYSFLRVDPDYRPAALYKKQNASKKSRSKWMRDFATTARSRLSGYGMSWVVRLLTRLRINQVFYMLNYKKIKYEKITGSDREWLLNQFRDDTLKLQQLTGRDLSSWLI